MSIAQSGGNLRHKSQQRSAPVQRAPSNGQRPAPGRTVPAVPAVPSRPAVTRSVSNPTVHKRVSDAMPQRSPATLQRPVNGNGHPGANGHQATSGRQVGNGKVLASAVRPAPGQRAEIPSRLPAAKPPVASRLGKTNGSANTNGNGHHLPGAALRAPAAPKPEAKILFQKFFRSVGPRTYAAQVKELPNGNHLLVLTEGKRDPKTQEVRKTRVFVYGEDFTALFRLLHETATFIRANPLSEEIRKRRANFWAKKSREATSARSE